MIRFTSNGSQTTGLSLRHGGCVSNRKVFTGLYFYSQSTWAQHIVLEYSIHLGIAGTSFAKVGACKYPEESTSHS